MGFRPQASRRQLLLAALGAPLALRMPSLFAAATCPPAASAPLGEFYKPGAPERVTFLADPSETGAAVRITGLLTAADTCRRQPAALIEVWQADASGRYDMDTMKLRGTFKPDALGRYQFDTVVPGHYGDRARTIHFRVTNKGYEPRVTQLFFAGDERERADTRVKPELTVTLGEAKDPARPKLLLAQFDISLTPETPADTATVGGWSVYAGSYELWLDQKMTIALEDKHLRWTLNRADNAGEPLTGLLYPRTGGLFYCPEYDYTVAFVKDDQGKVKHALLRGSQVAKKLS